MAISIPGTTANAATTQDPQAEGVPAFPVQAYLILAQTSRASIYQTEAPFEFEVDPTMLKVNELEKLFKKVQRVNSIPDIEDGYTESAVILPKRFKMSLIDRFDGAKDLMVYLRLFLNIL